MKLEQLVNKHYDKLNENDLYILNYICNNQKRVANLGIAVLAHKCSVSKSSLLRFTKKIRLQRL